MRVLRRSTHRGIIGAESVAYVCGLPDMGGVMTMVPLYLAALFASYLGHPDDLDQVLRPSTRRLQHYLTCCYPIEVCSLHPGGSLSHSR